MSHVAVRVTVQLGSRRDRRAVWVLAGEQRQAFNRGVGLCLEAVEGGVRLPSKFDLHKHLTADRSSGRMPSDVPVKVQRPGAEAGREAVVNWRKARQRLDRNAAYWSVRLAAAELRADGEDEQADILLAAVCCRAKLKPSLAVEVRYCAGRLDKARQRRDRHVEQGTQRLFRSRKELEREPRNMAAVVFNEAAQLRADGTVRLPGGMVLRLADRSWKPPDGHEWTGAVQLVDATRKVTSKTQPEHRRWVLHVILRRADPEPVDTPESRDEVIGVDAGVVNHVAVSDGRMMNMADETEANQHIKALQQDRSRCDYGSRRWKQITRELNQRLSAAHEHTRQRVPPARRERRQDTRCDRGRHRENQHDSHDVLSGRHQNISRSQCRSETRPQPVIVECPLRRHPQRHATSSSQTRRLMCRSDRCVHILGLPQMRLSSSKRKPIKLLVRNLRDRRPCRPSRSTQRGRHHMANRHR